MKSFKKLFKPTKKKVVISLLPLLLIILAKNILVVYFIAKIMAMPLKPILVPLGMYKEHVFTGSYVSFLGIIITAIFYSFVLYCLLSILSNRESR